MWTNKLVCVYQVCSVYPYEYHLDLCDWSCLSVQLAGQPVVFKLHPSWVTKTFNITCKLLSWTFFYTSHACRHCWLSVTLTGGHTIYIKQNLLASFSCTCFNSMGWHCSDEAFNILKVPLNESLLNQGKWLLYYCVKKLLTLSFIWMIMMGLVQTWYDDRVTRKLEFVGKWLEVAWTFTVVSCVREMTAKKSCKYGEYGSFSSY